MNEIAFITPGTGLTMSSLEIAAYAGKRHLHVLRDIRQMLSELQIEETRFGSFYIGGQGKREPCFNLPKRETMILVTGYSIAKRAAIIDRWQELEAMIANASPAIGNGLVTDLGSDVRAAIGGIIKSVMHKELAELLPDMVRSALASQTLSVRHGKTAGQIWREHGFPPMKITSWFSNRLCEMGCQIEGKGRAEIGGRTVKLYDPDKADLWLKNGGEDRVHRYVAERRGQMKLRLVRE